MPNSLITMPNNTLLSGQDAIRFAAGMRENNMGEAAESGSGGTQFVKFNGNTGDLQYGKGNDAILPDQVFVIPITTLKQGWIYWESKKPEKETQVFDYANRPFPKKPDNRGEVGVYANVKGKERDGWQRTWQLSLVGYEGPLAGFNCDFPGTSVAYQHFWTAIRNEFIAYMNKLEKDPDANLAAINPMLTIEVGNYPHKTYDKTIYTLIPHISAWTDGHEIVPVGPVTPELTAAKAEELDPLS